jgi:hypothetical protein
MPSTIRRAHFSSVQITTAAATFGFAPMPVNVWECSSRSSAYCRRP